MTLVKEEGNTGTFDAKTLTATIENTAGKTIKLHVVSESRSDGGDPPTITTGSTAKVDGGVTWLTVSENVDTAAGDYTLTLGDAQTLPAEATVTFTSTASTVGTTVKVVLKEATPAPVP